MFVQEKGWIYYRVIRTWFLNGFIENLGTKIVEMTGRFMSVSQLSDVGMMKPLKFRLFDTWKTWNVSEYDSRGGTTRMPTHRRKKVSKRAEDI